MRTPHLVAGGIAIGVLACAVVAMTLVAERHERKQVYALASQTTAHKSQGRALQLAALDRPDLLLVYGSSEMDGRFFNGNVILRSHPSGFFLFTVGGPPMRSLAIAQRVASLGPAVRDRPFAISISPQWFIEYRELPDYYFRGAFSRTHAFELVFSSPLSHRLRRQLAGRMLDYPRVVQQDKLLTLGLECAATRRLSDCLGFYAIWPLGKFDAFVLRTLDHWEALFPATPKGRVPRRPEEWPVPSSEDRVDWDRDRVDWDRILEQTDSPAWPPDRPIPRIMTRAEFLDRVENSTEWRDIDLLMRVLDELQARPLLIGMPLNGPVYDANGISRSDREIYYQKLREAVVSRGLPFVDFSEYDEDPRFLRGAGGHPSLRGWTYYVRALDDFRRETRR